MIQSEILYIEKQSSSACLAACRLGTGCDKEAQKRASHSSKVREPGVCRASATPNSWKRISCLAWSIGKNFAMVERHQHCPGPVPASNRNHCRPLMQPSRTRLTCRAHNRFTPSIALWQHFVAPWRPFFHQERLSSTASKPAEDGPDSETPRVSSPEASGLGLSGAISGSKRRPAALIRSHPLRVRKPKVRGDWHTSKVDASTASNQRSQAAAREASLDAPGLLLVQTRAAIEASNDYEGVVVKPMASPKSYREANLPWCLQPEEITMKGIERFALPLPHPDYLHAH